MSHLVTSPSSAGHPDASVDRHAPLVRSSADPRTLADDLVSWLGAPVADPFEQHLVVTTGPGASRWLSQRIGQARGICAAVEFLTPARLRRRLETDLLGIDPLTDPWAVEALTLRIAALLDQAGPSGWGEPIHAHLNPTVSGSDPRLAERPGRAISTAGDIARLLAHYQHRMPELVQRWDAGEAMDAAGDPLPPLQRWQFELHRRLRAEIIAPDPERRHRMLLDALGSDDGSASAWARAGVVALGRIDPADRELCLALGGSVPTRWWQLDRVRGDSGALHRLSEGQRLQRAGWGVPLDPIITEASADRPRADTVLARLQQAISGADPAPVAGPGDDSLSIHACHSDERQVQVLRDLLCGLFEDDPTLEPRDVLIVMPDPGRFAALLQAQFGGRPEDRWDDAEQAHPGRDLRVQFGSTLRSGTASVLDLVGAVLACCRGRASADDLIELCLSRPLAHRFGITAEDADAVRRLVGSSAIRWGLDRTDRVAAGLPEVGQGTWLNGVERLVTGAVFADTPITWIGNALPVERLEAQDLALTGTLAELVSRLRKTRLECASPTSAQGWGERLEQIIDLFADLPWSEQWALGTARSVIRRWAAKGSSVAAELDLAAIATVVRQLGTEWAGRPTFGNGNLLAVGLEDLRGVPHRVIAVLGLDDRSFPLRPTRYGNDLLSAVAAERLPDQVWHRLRETDRRVTSQAALVDALLSAEQTVLITHQGFDQRTGERLDPPVAVAELTHELDRLVSTGSVLHSHQLHAHAPLNFLAETGPEDEPGSGSFSFDGAALRGARALAGGVSQAGMLPGLEADPTGDPVSLRTWQVPASSSPEERQEQSEVLGLAELIGFLRHPAKAFLTATIGTSLSPYQRPESDQIPIDLYGLQAYGVGAQLLDRLRQGVGLDDAVVAAQLGGAVPPGALGRRAVDEVASTTARMAQVLGEISGAERDVAIDVEVGETRLVGLVRVRDHVVVDVSYGQLNGPNLVAVWVQLLALAANQPGPWTARIVHKDARRLELTAPPQDLARSQLREFLQRYQLGQQQVFVAPLRTLFLAAKEQGIWRHTEHRRYDTLAKSWRQERDPDWERFTPDQVGELFRTPAHPGLPQTTGQLASWYFTPISQAVI